MDDNKTCEEILQEMEQSKKEMEEWLANNESKNN